MVPTSDPKRYERLQRLQRLLASADLESEAAEVHGILCGLLCGGAQDARSTWLEELFSETPPGDLLVDECREALSRLYEETLSELDGPGLGFSLLLPEEDAPAQSRAEAVRAWSQGFLYGVGLSGVSPERGLSEEAREALHDIAEVTRLDLDQVSESDQDEDSLMEITEFLWVAAMLIREEQVHSREGEL
jgi:yecA family protein